MAGPKVGILSLLGGWGLKIVENTFFETNCVLNNLGGRLFQKNAKIKKNRDQHKMLFFKYPEMSFLFFKTMLFKVFPSE